MFLNQLNKILLALCLLILFSCASVKAPQGGPLDSDPPKLKSTTPAILTNLNQGQQITLSFNEFIKEDMPDGDITTNLTISNDKVVSSKMIAMESFIFCGEEYLPSCFPETCDIKVVAKDGEIVEPGDALVHIDGPANQILTFERVILNLTQRLCGISTETDKYCKLNLPCYLSVLQLRHQSQKNNILKFLTNEKLILCLYLTKFH